MNYFRMLQIWISISLLRDKFEVSINEGLKKYMRKIVDMGKNTGKVVPVPPTSHTERPNHVYPSLPQ